MKAIKIIGIIIGSIFAACCLAFWTLYLVGFRIYHFPTDSMQPTIQNGEILLGRLSGNYKERMRRFDLAIFHAPTQPPALLTKRIIGLPGERIIIDDSGVKINGYKISLPDSINIAGLGTKPCDIVIPEDAVFVLGDHTPNSCDSRYFGPVAKKSFVGYLIFK